MCIRDRRSDATQARALGLTGRGHGHVVRGEVAALVRAPDVAHVARVGAQGRVEAQTKLPDALEITAKEVGRLIVRSMPDATCGDAGPTRTT